MTEHATHPTPPDLTDADRRRASNTLHDQGGVDDDRSRHTELDIAVAADGTVRAAVFGQLTTPLTLELARAAFLLARHDP